MHEPRSSFLAGALLWLQCKCGGAIGVKTQQLQMNCNEGRGDRIRSGDLVTWIFSIIPVRAAVFCDCFNSLLNAIFTPPPQVLSKPRVGLPRRKDQANYQHHTISIIVVFPRMLCHGVTKSQQMLTTAKQDESRQDGRCRCAAHRLTLANCRTAAPAQDVTMVCVAVLQPHPQTRTRHRGPGFPLGCALPSSPTRVSNSLHLSLTLPCQPAAV